MLRIAGGIILGFLGIIFLLAFCTGAAINSAREEAAANPPRINLKNWSWAFSGSGRFCKGQGNIENIGLEAVSGLKLTVQFFDKAGNIVASGDSYPDLNTIPVGGSSPFDFFVSCPGNSADARITATHSHGSPVDLLSN